MSLPGDALPSTAANKELLSPDVLGRDAGVEDYERGGVAVSDPSQGLEGYIWRLRRDGNDMKLGRLPYTTETTLFTAAGVTELSLAFDQNMLPTVAYVQPGVASLRWWDATVNNYTTTILPARTRSVFLTMDDKRDFATLLSSNDVLLFYIRDNQLYYLQQRDRYGIARLLYTFGGQEASLVRVGMNRGGRIQIEVEVLPTPELGAMRPEMPVEYVVRTKIDLSGARGL